MISFPIFLLPDEEDKNQFQLLNSDEEIYEYHRLNPLANSINESIEQQKIASLKYCVNYCLNNNEDLFLFITDCHEKISNFNIEEIINELQIPLARGIDLLLLNALVVEELVPLTEKISWVNCFFGSTIMLFFRPSFDKIRNHVAVTENSFDTNLFELLNRKFILHEQIFPPTLPRLKLERYGEKSFNELLQLTDYQIQLYKNVFIHFANFIEDNPSLDEEKIRFIKKYSRYVVLKERYISSFL
ncbi:MAG: hypothetical protein LBF27_35100 [Sphingobacterium sp.]|jgi:hypothetical protein|nr:hypothetical protein [Sphingobacterium sp.]